MWPKGLSEKESGCIFSAMANGREETNISYRNILNNVYSYSPLQDDNFDSWTSFPEGELYLETCFHRLE